MNKNDIMYKCPMCNRVINELVYTSIYGIGRCLGCETPVIYFEPFKIDKDSKINKSPNMDPIMVAINKIIEEEKDKSYYKGFDEGAKCSSEKSYFEGYNRDHNEGYDRDIIMDTTRL